MEPTGHPERQVTGAKEVQLAPISTHRTPTPLELPGRGRRQVWV